MQYPADGLSPRKGGSPAPKPGQDALIRRLEMWEMLRGFNEDFYSESPDDIFAFAVRWGVRGGALRVAPQEEATTVRQAMGTVPPPRCTPPRPLHIPPPRRIAPHCTRTQ
eukprot:Hpha_TRINITY_DN22051_c0_g1::TRINITY_DN22051_c0_g1_i1::g.112104::m.112104